MTDVNPPLNWTAQLAAATRALAKTPSMPNICHALTLSWQTARGVTEPASPATVLGWIRLVEALSSARSDLMQLDGAPTLDADAVPINEPLADTPKLRSTLARLVRTAATALHRDPATVAVHDLQAALTQANVAATLDNALDDWP